MGNGAAFGVLNGSHGKKNDPKQKGVPRYVSADEVKRRGLPIVTASSPSPTAATTSAPSRAASPSRRRTSTAATPRPRPPPRPSAARPWRSRPCASRPSDACPSARRPRPSSAAASPSRRRTPTAATPRQLTPSASKVEAEAGVDLRHDDLHDGRFRPSSCTSGIYGHGYHARRERSRERDDLAAAKRQRANALPKLKLQLAQPPTRRRLRRPRGNRDPSAARPSHSAAALRAAPRVAVHARAASLAGRRVASGSQK